VISLKKTVIFVCVMLMAFAFISFKLLTPKGHIDNIHDDFQNQYSILLSQELLKEEQTTVPSNIDIPHWENIERTISQNKYSLKNYQGENLKKYTYYVLDSPYQRSLLTPQETIHAHVYTHGNKIVAAYLFQENNPENIFTLDFKIQTSFR